MIGTYMDDSTFFLHHKY